MFLITQTDMKQFIMENYFTFLMLGGLLIVMHVYRDVHLPASRNFLMIIIVLFLMDITNSAEHWAAQDPARLEIRTAASVLHYILQPLVIFLELIIIMPLPADHRDRKKSIFLLSIPALVNTVIYLIAPFSGSLVFIYDEKYYFNYGTLGFTIYVTTFIYLALLIIWSIRCFRIDSRRSIILFFIIGIAILTAYLEYINFAPGFIDEAFTLGVFLYCMYLITIHEAQMQTSLARQEVELSRKELELTQNRIVLMKQQIRPHFVFNSLYIIKSLIRTDQEKAVRCIEDFSDYLRANFDAITSDNLISFEEELSHTEAFLSLALADDSKNITVEYDLQELHFRVPPLTIEPMVENAIRHGVRNGGTVTISTRREDDHILINIADNGEGFDSARSSATEQERIRVGTGIGNVRTRLAMLCGGTLDISSNSEGTVVTMRIPAHRPAAPADPALCV